MSGRFFTSVLLTLFVFLPRSASAQNGVQLRYDFPKDEPVIYRTTTEMNQTMQFGGQTYENKVTQTEVNTLALQQITPEMNFKLRHVNMQLSVKADMGPAGTFNYDSKSAEREKGTALGNQLNPVFETLSGVEYDITITPQGKVEKLEGYKEIIETLVKDNPLAAQFTGGGSEQAQKDGLAEIFFPLKDKPVAQGDSWEVPFELELPKVGKAKGKRVYKFEGPITEDNPNVVRLSVSMEETSFDFNLDTEGAKITGSINVDSSKGDVRFDVEKGQVIQANLEYTLSGNIDIQAGERTLKSTVKQTQKRSTQRLSELPR